MSEERTVPSAPSLGEEATTKLLYEELRRICCLHFFMKWRLFLAAEQRVESLRVAILWKSLNDTQKEVAGSCSCYNHSNDS